MADKEGMENNEIFKRIFLETFIFVVKSFFHYTLQLIDKDFLRIQPRTRVDNFVTSRALGVVVCTQDSQIERFGSCHGHFLEKYFSFNFTFARYLPTRIPKGWLPQSYLAIENSCCTSFVNFLQVLLFCAISVGLIVCKSCPFLDVVIPLLFFCRSFFFLIL